jgi:RNA polymerase sigma-B factor
MATDADQLFDEYRRTGRRSTRNAIVEAHMGLAIHIARRFDGRTRRDGDIEQVAMLALVKAVDRFDSTLGVPFVAFAGRTIEGEIKRYFRDATWAMKVPRGAKELHLAVRKGVDELSAVLGRSPTVDEVAEHLGVPRDDVITGLAAGEARSIGSIDPGPDDGAGATDRAASTTESGYDAVDNDDTVQTLLASLPERERTIVQLRFYDELSQSEIAARVGVSQMHVSRLLRAALERLREQAGNDL